MLNSVEDGEAKLYANAEIEGAIVNGFDLATPVNKGFRQLHQMEGWRCYRLKPGI